MAAYRNNTIWKKHPGHPADRVLSSIQSTFITKSWGICFQYVRCKILLHCNISTEENWMTWSWKETEQRLAKLMIMNSLAFHAYNILRKGRLRDDRAVKSDIIHKMIQYNSSTIARWAKPSHRWCGKFIPPCHIATKIWLKKSQSQPTLRPSRL